MKAAMVRPAAWALASRAMYWASVNVRPTRLMLLGMVVLPPFFEGDLSWQWRNGAGLVSGVRVKAVNLAPIAALLGGVARDCCITTTQLDIAPADQNIGVVRMIFEGKYNVREGVVDAIL